MKILKRITLWIIISLAVQFGGLFYANNYLFASNTNVQTKKVENNVKKAKEVDINIPDGARELKVSYDGKYVSYFENDEMKVVNTKNGDVKKVELNGAKVSHYIWLSDRNRMLLSEKKSSSSSKTLITFYDVDKGMKDDVKEIELGNSRSEVTDIQASPLTNVIYVKASNGTKRSSLYWLNIMKELKSVDVEAYNIGRIALAPHEDKLLYEDSTKKKVFVTGNDASLKIEGAKSLCLIGVDGEDNAYVGDLQDENVTQIFKASLKEKNRRWEKIDIGTSIKRASLTVDCNGKIYANDELQGTVKEIGSGKVTTYKGKFIQMYSDGVASISEGKLIKTSIK